MQREMVYNNNMIAEEALKYLESGFLEHKDYNKFRC